MFRNLSIRKRFEVKAPTHPTHDLVAINDSYDKETAKVVGSLWTKVAQDKNGTDFKFLSGSLAKDRKGTDGKEYDGYVLITEKEYAEYQKLMNSLVTPSHKQVEIGGYDGEIKDISEIDF